MRRFPLVLVPFLTVAATLAAEAPAEKPWKVDDPHGPTSTVSFTTDEGTWLHLDVSPDGRSIVFSLLGDLYVIPAAGGEAKRITSGPSMDVQPRFSPDGRRIAFASDRGGLENLWIADLDGANARQVSTEKASTVSAPAWSPDGQWLLGRKRVTDASSIGLVELWIWHLRGGEGVQVTKKDEQPDAADAAFSPDGRYVYFSARDGRYRYNRKVNDGIWQIKRLDRNTGQVVPLTGEFGGSAAPTPSPDGASLAFVRRVRAKTRLEVLDLASGRTRIVAPEVQRDNQEGFAFHGVYPGFAWTPDSKSIVTTAEGKIWSWDAATGARAAIPFRASVEHKVADALREPRRAGEGDVRIRIVRWPVESPDGRRLVFSAAGHLYAMDLPGGKPARLTTGTDLEYAPAFSRDGSTLAFVSWNDREGGYVWTMPAAGGAAKKITPRPGHYANPSFSPDGTRIVFLASSGATFRGDDLGNELWHEIRVVPAAGGEPKAVVGAKNRGPNRRMPRPMYDAKGERILFVDDDPPGKPGDPPRAALVSVKEDGTDRRTHLRWGHGEEAVVSPDGRFVVYNERHNAFVAAMPALDAQTVDLSASGAPLPVARLTDSGGEWVNWADGGKTVTWVYGPVYRRIALEKAMPEPKPPAEEEKGTAKDKGKGDEKKDAATSLPESTAIEIVLNLPRARPSGTTAYTNARIVTLKGDEVLERGTIVVKDDRIVSVGSAAPPAGATVVDLPGTTIIPGLIDEHAHLHYSTLDVFPEKPWKYAANLAYGITTTHDPSASTQEVFAQAEMVEAGLMTGPRIYSTGFILYGANLPGKAVIDRKEDAVKHLERLKSLGAFSVKSYMQPRRDVRQWILDAARKLDMLVVPEGGGDLENNVGMILDGHTTIEHALPIAPLYKDVVTLFAKSGTAYTPTLLVAYGGISGDKWFHQHYELWKDDRLQRFVPQSIVDSLGRVRDVMATDPADWHHVDVAASAKRIVDAGGRVCLGGHGQMQGLGPHWELWAFVQGGMSPLQALRVGSLYPAQTLGLDRDLGSIEAGKLADFVVLEKNPLEKIENTETVRLVVKNGRAYTPDELALPKR